MSEILNFEVGVNLAGASPVDVMQQDPPAGPVEVEILDVRQVTKEGEGGGKTTLRFNVGLINSPAAGLSTQVVIGTDWSKPFNVGHLKNLLLGMHNASGQYANPEKLNGVVNLKPEMFKGTRAFIFVKTFPEGEIDESTGKAKRADKNFITKSMFESAVKAAALGNVTPITAARPAAPTPSAAPGPIVTQVATAPAAGAPLGDLFAS